jgi:hypothetical protein
MATLITVEFENGWILRADVEPAVVHDGSGGNIAARGKFTFKFSLQEAGTTNGCVIPAADAAALVAMLPHKRTG